MPPVVELDHVRSLLSSSVDVNTEGYTPLMAAAENGHTKVVKALLKAGADVNATTLVEYGGMVGWTDTNSGRTIWTDASRRIIVYSIQRRRCNL